MVRGQSLHAWGARLAQLRRNAALTGAEVVAKLASLGIRLDRRTIYAYEAGRIAAPDAGAVWGLAKIYGVSVEELSSALVQSRTGQKPVGLQAGASGQDTVRVTIEERDLIQQLRTLPSKSREACRDFVAFETHRHARKPTHGRETQ